MCIKITACFIYCILLLTLHANAQAIPVDDNSAASYRFVHPQFNYISNIEKLDSFYAKLYNLKKNGTGRVTIVHIGDSHLQAGFITAPVRKKMQGFFGNAGRGLVFPYQLARSNAPADIGSSSNVSWQYNRLAHPEIPVTTGISGFCIQSASPNATIHIALKPVDDSAQAFTTIRLFTGTADSSWFVQAENNDAGYQLASTITDTLAYKQVTLDKPATGFTASASGTFHQFYGASLERADNGVLYHSIGVNGATYGQYNKAYLFWQQVAALHADLYIISLGTNEAQKAIINQQELDFQILSILSNIKASSPDAAVLITSPADSYFGGKKISTSMKQVSAALSSFCTDEKLPFWDLYTITGGYGSARSWEQSKLMSRDRIHYIQPGYVLQGNLLFTALANGYNEFIKRFNNPFDLLKSPVKTEDR